ncbi:MAG: TetR/AcrR family transcriptional regulator, partial [Pleurocapsa sp. SU_196_0]|nr:TetR/AcrR family transcriptional regulator [Pleurocapsa sp. SU_196_0]
MTATASSYHEVSVAAICNAANVGRSTFYTHYLDKEGLLNECVAEVFGKLLTDAFSGDVAAVDPWFNVFVEIKQQAPLLRTVMFDGDTRWTRAVELLDPVEVLVRFGGRTAPTQHTFSHWSL